MSKIINLGMIVLWTNINFLYINNKKNSKYKYKYSNNKNLRRNNVMCTCWMRILS